ncbi:helix-turn-helix domain-containing protein [Methylocystis sp.]|uniref:helix-turn-helix domain-containing protein n=1 Tax=Methylocystis sp. TaxID=1911079 RepID=UPI003D0A17E7
MDLDLRAITARVEKRLEKVGLKAATASRLAGKRDAIRNLQRAARSETGRRGVSTDTVAALAPVLRTRIAWLLTGEGPEELDEPDTKTVPIVGYVGAGAETFFESGQGPFDYVEAPDGATEDTVAVEIRGTSLGELFDRWLIFYDQRREPVTSDLIGKLCVVGLADERIVVKKLKRGQRKDKYDLLSNTEPPLYDQSVIWAARVKQMVPK